MAGTVEGAKKAARTNRMRYGENYYGHIGQKGGSVKHPDTRPFKRSSLLAIVAGRKGGKISKRKKEKI